MDQNQKMDQIPKSGSKSGNDQNPKSGSKSKKIKIQKVDQNPDMDQNQKNGP